MSLLNSYTPRKKMHSWIVLFWTFSEPECGALTKQPRARVILYRHKKEVVWSRGPRCTSVVRFAFS